jgi:hypothetical protein
MDHKMSHKESSQLKSVAIWSILIVIFAGGFFAWSSLSKVRQKIGETEFKSAMATIAQSEEFYYNEWGKYGRSGEDIGFLVEGRNYVVYYSTEAVPNEIKSAFPESTYPYSSADSYRVWLVIKQSGEPVVIWNLQSDGGKTKLFEMRPIPLKLAIGSQGRPPRTNPSEE